MLTRRKVALLQGFKRTMKRKVMELLEKNFHQKKNPKTR